MPAYLKFLIKSTNQHGVHSPFVFDYLTKCLYKKPKQSRKKVENLVLKSIDYFNYEHIVIFDNPILEDKIYHKSSVTFTDAEPVDVLYFSNMGNNRPNDIFSNHSLHNQSMLIFADIRSSKESFTCWTDFIKSDKITVSIDFYSCGVAFLRQEQVKEHFTIRL